MKRIGVLAGTFDPVHDGHIAFCLAAINRGKLEQVYLLPERVPRTKQNVGDFDARVMELQAATAAHPNLNVLVLQEPCFSVDETLPQLKELFAPARLVLLLGSDVACASLPHWGKLGMLTLDVDFIIGVRSGHTVRDVQQCMRAIETEHSTVRYTIIDSPLADVSSSKIRAAQMQ